MNNSLPQQNIEYTHKDFLVLAPENVNYNSLTKDLDFKLNLNIPKAILGDIIRRTSHVFEGKKRNESVQLSSLKTEDLKVPVCATVLREIYGGDYTKALKLFHSKILYRYEYAKGLCTPYALNDFTREHPLRIERLDYIKTKDKGIVERLLKNSQVCNSVTKKKFRPLIKFFDNKRLTIDVEAAFRQIETDCKLPNDYGKYIITKQKVLDIHNGAYRQYYNPESDGRLHNNFTSFNKSLRKYLRYDGRKIAEVDLSNSIPFIFSQLLSNSININLQDTIHPLLFNLSYMFHKMAESIDKKELEVYQNLCSTGMIYEDIQKDYVRRDISSIMDEHDGYIDEDGYHFDIDDEGFRKLTKSTFLSMLFSENETFSVFELVFEERFPTIYNLIYTLKEKFEYKLFSHYLFQVESEIMLNQIAKPYNASRNGKIPILTIHDCICTVVGEEESLKEFMEKKLLEIFTTLPKMKVKYW